jgi:hypothetical protein
MGVCRLQFANVRTGRITLRLQFEVFACAVSCRESYHMQSYEVLSITFGFTSQLTSKLRVSTVIIRIIIVLLLLLEKCELMKEDQL